VRWILIIALSVMSSARDAEAQDTGDAIDQVIRSALNLVELRGAIEQMLAQQSATFPIGSSSAAFNWFFNPDIGGSDFVRSFGPIFAERASTIGARRASVSLLYQRIAFKEIDGQALDRLETIPVHNSRVSVPTITRLDIGLDRGIVHTSLGLTENVDVGASVPFGRSTFDGSSQATYLCAAPDSFYCPDGNSVVFPAVSRRASSWGVGDVMLRTKVNFFSLRGAGGARNRVADLATLAEVRLPTGDPNKLLGRGRAQLQAMLLGSGTFKRVSIHSNVGYTFGGRGLECDPTIVGNCLPPNSASAVLTEDFGFIQHPSPELNYVVGVEGTFGELTVAGDLIGRALRGAAVFEYLSGEVQGLRGSGFRVSRGTVNLLLLGVGAKRQLWGSRVLNVGALIPLNGNGVKPGITPLVSIEQSF
jgi:hypothetical protein